MADTTNGRSHRFPLSLAKPYERQSQNIYTYCRAFVSLARFSNRPNTRPKTTDHDRTTNAQNGKTTHERLESEPSRNARELMAILLFGEKSESEHVSVRRVTVLVKSPNACACRCTSGRPWFLPRRLFREQDNVRCRSSSCTGVPLSLVSPGVLLLLLILAYFRRWACRLFPPASLLLPLPPPLNSAPPHLLPLSLTAPNQRIGPAENPSSATGQLRLGYGSGGRPVRGECSNANRCGRRRLPQHPRASVPRPDSGTVAGTDGVARHRGVRPRRRISGRGSTLRPSGGGHL